MSSFLYYVSGGGDVIDVAAHGLADAFSAGHASCRIAGGPDGKSGCLFRERTDPVHFSADSQTWRQVPGMPGLLVGVENDSRPTPTDLARATFLPGKWVELADGHRWYIPVARSLSIVDERIEGDISLPRSSDVSDSGEWVMRDVIGRYRPLWDAVCGALDWAIPVDNEGAHDLLVSNPVAAHDLALLALRANYRVAFGVQLGMLGALTVGHCGEIVKALIDFEVYVAWKKKQAQRVGLTASDGFSSETHDTAQA